MGQYVNPANAGFGSVVNSQIYVDKTELLRATWNCEAEKAAEGIEEAHIKSENFNRINLQGKEERKSL